MNLPHHGKLEKKKKITEEGIYPIFEDRIYLARDRVYNSNVLSSYYIFEIYINCVNHRIYIFANACILWPCIYYLSLRMT